VRVGRPVAGAERQLVRKAVNTLAIVPKSTRITTLARKSYNVLLYQAQEQGLEHDVFKAQRPWLDKEALACHGVYDGGVAVADCW
jgi:hypothetical protein